MLDYFKNSPLCSQLGIEGVAMVPCLLVTKGTVVTGGDVSFFGDGHWWRSIPFASSFFLFNINLNTSAKGIATNSVHTPLVIFLISQPF